MLDFFRVSFSVSGVESLVFVPPLVAFVVSVFTSMAGVSGAFLLLPFQVSILQFTSPSVSATNFVYNIVAIPSGVYSFIKQGRMAWPLSWVIIVGTLPGVFLGYFLRVLYLPDPRSFKLFVGCVLLYIGGRLLYEITPRSQKSKNGMRSLEKRFNQHVKELKKTQKAMLSAGLPSDAVIRTISFSPIKVEYEFWGQRFSFHTLGMFLLAFVVGIIGGTYGIGGGAIIAPFCVAVFNLPVYTVAGSALLGTFITSIAGVLFYNFAPSLGKFSTQPDLSLGFLFGIGGFAGMYCGARLQKFVPQKFIKLLLGLIMVFLSSTYIVQFF